MPLHFVILEIYSIPFVVQTLERSFDLNPSGRYVRFLGLRRLEQVRNNGRRGWWIRADATSTMELSGWVSGEWCADERQGRVVGDDLRL
jgi:hypothetical protein